ncbi:LysR family transcriptional regulator [Bradyrhizobium vignae]|uniref:LysR family transcriptional regulator n=1 Tax=Bradyrhizobium vignae TaxID=1549949 RepID=UPI00100AE334|nr:LysR family transcriptional regulator [Bradyrhizobium vignae]RXH02179.1 LysR family transcriptional regulator [Bradyrhizobium vignae]
MEFRHLRYFVAVAEELSFTRAAERLGISQPPLSAQIRQLEQELGSQLLIRRVRGMELTNAGKVLLEEARLILKQVAATKTSVRQRARAETGRLILGSSGGTYFYPLIPQIIQEYGKRYPDITLIPQASNTAQLTARLRTGNIDVAVLRSPIGGRSGLVLEPLGSEDSVVALPKSHKLGRLESVPLALLSKEVFVFYPRELNPDNYDAVIAACRAAGYNPILGQQAPQTVAILPLVAAGLGISIVPRSATKLLSTDITYVPIEGHVLRSDLCLARRSRDASRAARDFVLLARSLVRAKGAMGENGGNSA